MELTMKMKSIPLLIAVVFFAPLVALADPDKDERGHGKRKYGRGEYKEEYWDGNCKVERKIEGNGEYKEERKCKGYTQGPRPSYAPARVHVPPPVYIPSPEPGIVIQGTVRVNE